MLIDLVVLTDQAIKICRIAIVLVKDIQIGVVNTDQQVCTPNEEGVLVCRSLNHLDELKIQWMRKPGDGEDHFTEMTEYTSTALKT